MADAADIRAFLVARGLASPGASSWDLLEAFDAAAGLECARLEAMVLERDRQIERLEAALIRAGVGGHMLDWFKLKRE
jgi:hypothetical protein